MSIISAASRTWNRPAQGMEHNISNVASETTGNQCDPVDIPLAGLQWTPAAKPQTAQATDLHWNSLGHGIGFRHQPVPNSADRPKDSSACITEISLRALLPARSSAIFDSSDRHQHFTCRERARDRRFRLITEDPMCSALHRMSELVVLDRKLTNKPRKMVELVATSE
ncbi:hypothetical protein K438DRAFT_1788320 [Mycena galopus ATCC 62051]|nr:hypothetical protein K438DRAFT_1788320 [Mycena galopus ATCC 62051]